MKTSKSIPARKRRQQRYCQYLDSDTGKLCDNPLLGQGRLSQGRRYFCHIHSKAAEETLRKQKGALWVMNSRQRRRDLEVIRNQKRSFTNKVLSSLEERAPSLPDAGEFLEFCDVFRSRIVRWEREERLFADKMFNIGYPVIYSSALVLYEQQLVQPINSKLSASYLNLSH
jgi:hypothetical protein